MEGDYNACILERGREAVPYFLNGNILWIIYLILKHKVFLFFLGDKRYNVPSFSPLKLKEIVFSPSGTLKIILTDIELSGFDKVILNKIKWVFLSKTPYKQSYYCNNFSYDIPGGKINFVLSFPEMHINTTYKTIGRILVLPFEGSGPSHMNISKYLIFLDA